LVWMIHGSMVFGFFQPFIRWRPGTVTVPERRFSNFFC
jgi:hypothetical protein